jgi:hypothetical protein
MGLATGARQVPWGRSALPAFLFNVNDTRHLRALFRGTIPDEALAAFGPPSSGFFDEINFEEYPGTPSGRTSSTNACPPASRYPARPLLICVWRPETALRRDGTTANQPTWSRSRPSMQLLSTVGSTTERLRIPARL